MLARGILGSVRTDSVSSRPFPNSSGWWWLVSSVILIRISCHKTTHANGYYGAWPGWVVSISVLPLTIWQSVSQSVQSFNHQSCLTLCHLSCVWLFVTPKYMACVLCILGTADVPGCGHRLHSRGVGMPGPRSAGLVQGCDVRELRDPGLLGWGQLPSRIPFPPLGLVPVFLEHLL